MKDIEIQNGYDKNENIVKVLPISGEMKNISQLSAISEAKIKGKIWRLRAVLKAIPARNEDERLRGPSCPLGLKS
jgi:hypothetical protein